MGTRHACCLSSGATAVEGKQAAGLRSRHGKAGHAGRWHQGRKKAVGAGDGSGAGRLLDQTQIGPGQNQFPGELPQSGLRKQALSHVKPRGWDSLSLAAQRLQVSKGDGWGQGVPSRTRRNHLGGYTVTTVRGQRQVPLAWGVGRVFLGSRGASRQPRGAQRSPFFSSHPGCLVQCPLTGREAAQGSQGSERLVDTWRRQGPQNWGLVDCMAVASESPPRVRRNEAGTVQTANWSVEGGLRAS